MGFGHRSGRGTGAQEWEEIIGQGEIRKGEEGVKGSGGNGGEYWGPEGGLRSLCAQEGECQFETRAEPRDKSQAGEIRGPREFEEEGRMGSRQAQRRTGARGAYRTHDTHDAFPQQPRVDVIGALAATLGEKGVGEGQGQAVPPASSPRAVSQDGRRTVCSTTMGMSGMARAAVACRLRCRTRPVLGVR